MPKKTKSKKPKGKSMITLRNNKGEIKKLPGSLTIRDLVKLGMRGIGLIKPKAPLPDGWWRSES